MIVGITGGIATGKSTVSKLFAQAGWPVLDIDQLASDIRDHDSVARQAIIKRFGKQVDGNSGLDTQLLGRLVFADRQALYDLNAILQPRIRVAILKKIHQFQAKRLVLDMPLLFEQQYQDVCDVVVVVATDYQTQLKRLEERNDLSHNEARQRIASQLPLAEKVQQADWTIDNSQSLRDTQLQVVWLLNYLDHNK